MDILDNVREKFNTLAADMGLELVEINALNIGGRTIIRAIVHKLGGVTVGECARFSRAMEDYFDTEDVIHGRYNLEVSSLGLDKPLLAQPDFRRRIGETISLELRPGIYDKNVAKGDLTSADESGITITVDGLSEKYPYENIIRGKIVY
jgi:ribosome maturation factor RimP